jgi:hypothetical protein
VSPPRVDAATPNVTSADSACSTVRRIRQVRLQESCAAAAARAPGCEPWRVAWRRRSRCADFSSPSVKNPARPAASFTGARVAAWPAAAWALAHMMRSVASDETSMSTPSTKQAENADRSASRIHVRLADHDGRHLRVERDGEVITTEHFPDWHRVERRRASLEAEMSHAAARPCCPGSSAPRTSTWFAS